MSLNGFYQLIPITISPLDKDLKELMWTVLITAGRDYKLELGLQ